MSLDDLKLEAWRMTYHAVPPEFDIECVTCGWSTQTEAAKLGTDEDPVPHYKVHPQTPFSSALDDWIEA